ALMSLGIRQGDEVIITGSGPQASATIAGIRSLIANLEEVAPPVRDARTAQPAPTRTFDDKRLRGVIASRGLAVGRAFYLRAAQVAVNETGRGVALESAELERGRAEVRDRLQQLAK